MVRVLAGVVVCGLAWSAEEEPSPRRPILGTINHIPRETVEARDARRAAVRERRSRLPIMVHRGARVVARENTLAAYAGAMDLGADGVEIDIRRSKDGVLYLFHDDTLERETRGVGPVRERTYFEFLAITPKDGPVGPDTRVPTLPALLALARERAMLLHLDVKEPGLQDAIIALVEAADMWEHIVEVNAANAERIRHHPRVALMPYKGWWPEGAAARDPAHYGPFLKRDGAMVFTKDPRPAVEILKRTAPPAPPPMPAHLHARWTSGGIAAGR